MLGLSCRYSVSGTKPAFVLAAFLILITQGTGFGEVIVVTPNQSFEVQVRAAIAAWEETDDCRDNPIFRELRNTVLRPGHTVFVVKTDEGMNHTERGPWYSIVYWNPDLRTRYKRCGQAVPAVSRDPFASLIHEFGHAARNARGERGSGSAQCHTQAGLGQFAGENEQSGGLLIENIYLRSHKLPMRENYDCCMVRDDTHEKCCSGGPGCMNQCCPEGNECVENKGCRCKANHVACTAAGANGMCCESGGECGGAFVDGVTGRAFPAYCCGAGTRVCGYRPRPDAESKTACCSAGQRCDGVLGCTNP